MANLRKQQVQYRGPLVPVPRHVEPGQAVGAQLVRRQLLRELLRGQPVAVQHASAYF